CVDIIRHDPAVDNVIAFGGGGGARNSARLFAQLKPIGERKISADRVIARLRERLAGVAGASLYLQSVQDIRVGGRASSSQSQSARQAGPPATLTRWSQVLLEKLSRIPGVRDANADQQDSGLESALVVDRDTAARLGVSMQALDDALNDAFGQRPVSTIYK